MLSSVTKYLLGRSQEHNEGAIEQQRLGNTEHLESQQEDDWVLVHVADKENNGHQPVCSCQRHSSLVAGHDSLSQNSSSDAELLDDADTLAYSISMGDLGHPSTDACSESIHWPLLELGWTNQDVDKYSDTDSLPESVFSACSGRSHATYHPCGSRSEPWVVAPPPCFTGSQVGGLSPVASPLENLLIEHPSMSVYLSFPPSHSILPNHPKHEALASNTKERRNNEETNGQHVLTDQILNVRDHPSLTDALQQRSTHTAVSSGLLLGKQLLKDSHFAQRLQYITTKQDISKSKCDLQNKVREYRGHAKSNNRINKRVRPSGFKCSRLAQHMSKCH